MANRFETIGKRILTSPLGLIPEGPPPPLPAPPDSIRRVLIVRPDERIGNLVLLTPMLDAIGQSWPGVGIDLVAGAAVYGLMSGDPRIGDVIVFDKRALIRNPFGLIPMARRLRRAHYDLAVDASHSHHFSLTSALLTRASGARYRLGYRHDAGASLVNVGLRRRPGERPHTVDLYMNLLRVVAPEAAGRTLHLPIGEAETAEARRRLESAGMTGGVRVGIHPGGRGSKRWPVERFIELAGRLRDAGAQTLLFAGPGEDEIADRFPNDLVVRVPRLPLRIFAAGIRECALFISSDTGPMHLAAAVGVPTLSLFTQGNADMFAPIGDMHRHLNHPMGPSVDETCALALRMLDGSIP